MKTLLIAISLSSPTATVPQTPIEPQTQLAVMCFKTGERQDGMNKICYYNCAGSDAAITVKSYELCPLSIND